MLDAPTPSTGTLGDYLDDGAYGAGFRTPLPRPDHVRRLVDGRDRILDFPVDYLLRFLDHHGLIGYGNALQWRTISGGSMRYVDRIVASLPPGTIRSGSPGRRRVAERGRRHGPHRGRRLGALRRRRHGDACRRGPAPSSTTPIGASGRARRLRLLDQPGRPAHRRTASCHADLAPGHHGTSTRRTARDPARRSR